MASSLLLHLLQCLLLHCLLNHLDLLLHCLLHCLLLHYRHRLSGLPLCVD